VVSDNITVTHLLNVKRLAYPLSEPPPGAYEHAPDVRGAPREDGASRRGSTIADGPVVEDRVDRIVRRVLQELGGDR
jgi:acetaldehyde dehydrogenase (acetylating)